MPTDIRNITVIAHVDHGKTTLVDALLKQTHTFRANQEEMLQDRIMDSDALEREKGITILSKNTSIHYKGTKINIIDTPGHADFGGEVERIMNMADGALLVVDAAEGPLAQTKFVLKKALDFGLKIILVINKIDRKDAIPQKVLQDTEELFLTLATTSDTLDFPVVYSVGREGMAFLTLPHPGEKSDITPLLDTILTHIPSASHNAQKPFQMLVSAFEKNDYLGRLAVGRINAGHMETGTKVALVTSEGVVRGTFRIEKMYTNVGIEKKECSFAPCGEIVYLSGIPAIEIGQTLTDPATPTPLPAIEVAEPTLKASFGPNTSVFAKSESRFLTSRELKARLEEEVSTNLGLKIEDDPTDTIRVLVSGRGELHLAVLIEKLRREGYAFEVGKPEVILKKLNGQLHEPFSELTILVDQAYVGEVSVALGQRRAIMQDMQPDSRGAVKMVYKLSERNALGLRTSLMTKTKGSVSLSFLPLGYQVATTGVKRERNGALIATQSGKALSYGLDLAQKRGITFVGPTEDVYEGQVVGVRPVVGDLEINVTKGKQLTNMRAAGNDDSIILAPPVRYSLEECLDFVAEDEYIDITPAHIRLRKKYLTKLNRVREARQARQL